MDLSLPVIEAKFLDPLVVRKLDDGRWRLTHELRYDSAAAGGRIIVPVGFETDFASVPRVPLAFILFGDTAHEAAVVHDYLYATKVLPRALADHIFDEAMKVCGIPLYHRLPMYLAVAVFGETVWREHWEIDPPADGVIVQTS